MRVLHIAAHLGGGVGKAHSALCSATAGGVRRHYVLLEEPRDLRFATSMRAEGASISAAPGFDAICRLAADADVVQIEWWNHPRLFEFLCRANLPPMRAIIWSHVSGLAAPYIPDGLFEIADSFFLTSECSFAAPNIIALPDRLRCRIGVAPSGFGLERPPQRTHPVQSGLPVAYLGTVDFAKLSSEFFDVIDEVREEFTVSVWGAVDPKGAVARRAAQMRHAQRVQFKGHTEHPEQSLATPGIFLYLLRRDHFGTGENALIEAMSLGWVPLVFGNPAESAIVRHGETGFIENNVASAATRLAWMLRNPEAVGRMGERAADEIAASRLPRHVAEIFDLSYREVARHDKKVPDFSSALGRTPAEWFLSTQGSDELVGGATDLPASKGSFNHFIDCFPSDESLIALQRARLHEVTAAPTMMGAQ